MTVEIIQIDESNMGLLKSIDQDIFDEKIDPVRLAVLLKEQNHILLAAITEGMVVGQVLAQIHRHPDKPKELYIDDLAVSETVQRRGVATRLLEQLFEMAVKRGCQEIWVATEPENEPAKKFYSSLKLSMRQVVVFEGTLPGLD
jgi:aminoglycoside 6'-N-acetyltransferase I